ncbi:MAG: TIGR03960 family B12-binding radical SAM protein [Nitrospirae bacterium]|nr:TIGR03960 family B12-binding radical SAM protein [Nitrospirota bacterium]
MYEDFLPLVAKPARYINTEINAIHKDLAQVKTRICLFFPDTYEIGMSHLGIRILYHILNNRPDTACERVFSPWTDYEDRLRASGRPLTSLESNLPLAEFDIIGITLQYELSYSNILTGLELAKIPIRSEDRTDSHPVIIAGGPCAVNPEPLSDFIDVFFIGEAEESVHEIVALRQKHPGRQEFLNAISKLEGFYVPSLGKAIVRRRYLKSIETAPYPDKPLVPLMKPIHDRVTVEVARGCIRGCRFCQAGIIYRPYRERGAETVKGLLDGSLSCTGYDELSLASLSTGDYSEIQPLIIELMERYRDSRVSVSLPSLRVGTLTPEMIRAIAGTRKTGFTLAPEAGTERLRRVINKPVSDRDLLDAAETIFRSGWNTIKLYFMIGLPTETDEDLDGIIRLANELFSVGKRTSKRPIQLNISVSTFVPKPHTPFQWHGQASITEVRRKQAYLEKGLKRRGITLKGHNPETSLLEGTFARGDRKLGRVIEEAVRLGCRFDGWTECFDFKKWTEAFQKCGLDAPTYASRTFGLEDKLPWGFVKSGVTREFLKREYHRAVEEKITENCRVVCEHCGIGCADGGTNVLGRPAVLTTTKPMTEGTASADRKKPAGVPDMTSRVRMKVTKAGRIRFLSHLDFMTLFHRAVVRAQVPVAFSQGFNPHLKVAFGPALPVGMESGTEYLDLEIDPFADLLQITRSLNSTLPEGVRILESKVVAKKAPSLSGSISRYTYEVAVGAQHRDGTSERVKDFLSRTSVIVSKEGKQKDIRPCIESITEGLGSLVCTLVDHDQLKPRMQDVIERLFNIGKDQSVLFRVKRVGMYCKEKDQWVSPMSF